MISRPGQLELEELILKQMDGVLSEAEYATLCARLRREPESLRTYLEYLLLCSELLKPGELTLAANSDAEADDPMPSALLLALAEDERTAETIYLDEPVAESPVTIKPKDRIPFKQRISSTSLYMAILSTAALFLMIGYVVTHPRITPEAVATLTGSRQAVWEPLDAQADSVKENGRLYTNSALRLVEGFAEITFDNEARILLQSPAEICIEKYDQIFLRSGKLSAVIPEPARGFVVRTTGATLVDYGTEFGIITDASGRTEAHVFVGEVELRSGSDPVRFNTNKKLVQGQAGRVSETGQLAAESTQADPASFVRHLPERSSFSQPGKRLDLADLVGGGNGFGTGRQDGAIDPSSGERVDMLRFGNRPNGDRSYSPTPQMPCIDGVFVPVGGSEPQVITTQGHIFEDCPETDGHYWNEISNNPITSLLGTSDDYQRSVLNGVQYGTAMHPAIMLHSNAGITFDLDAIRSTTPGVQIRRFTSLCGLSETLLDTDHKDSAKATLWILVDGQKRQVIYLSSGTQQRAAVSVDLQDNDRFLTLITTDGGNTNGGDWALFGDPGLELEPIE